MLAVVNGEILELEQTELGWRVHLVNKGQTFNCSNLSEVLFRIFSINSNNIELKKLMNSN